METTVSNKLDQFIADLKASPIAMPIALQEAAHGYLLGQDFPTTKAERFKYTRLGKLAASAFDSAIQLDQTQLKEHCVCSDAYTIFVNNDQIIVPQSLPLGLEISLLTEANTAFHEASFNDIFGALNVLYAQNVNPFKSFR